MGICAFLLLTTVSGGFAIMLLAYVLMSIPRVEQWQLKYRLVASHTLIVLTLIAYSPISIRLNEGSPYGDLYLPFYFVPGFPVQYFANRLCAPAFPWLLQFMESFPASVITLIILPGALSILIGGAGWFLAGAAWTAIGKRQLISSHS